MEVKDPYNHKRTWENWFSKVNEDKKVKGLNQIHSRLFIRFLKDLSLGLNISKMSKKGARTPNRLNHLRIKLIFILKQIEKRKIKDVRKITKQQIHQLFNDMRTGVLPNRFGKPYKATGDYVKDFKVFWHWYQKTSKDKIEDVAEDLDRRGEKPKFIYFDKNQYQRILNEASYDLKVALALAFDSGMRVTELINIKVSDFSNDFKEVTIREETSKTFGRKIKLMLSSRPIREYVMKLELNQDNFLIRLHPQTMNKELNKLGLKLLSPRQLEHKNLSLYDFRHSSACFFLPKYKSESALKYRFGWKKSDMIHYYTELLGMKDTISQDDMFEDITKVESEKEIEKLKLQVEHNEEFLKSINNQMQRIIEDKPLEVYEFINGKPKLITTKKQKKRLKDFGDGKIRGYRFGVKSEIKNKGRTKRKYELSYSDNSSPAFETN